MKQFYAIIFNHLKIPNSTRSFWLFIEKEIISLSYLDQGFVNGFLEGKENVQETQPEFVGEIP